MTMREHDSSQTGASLTRRRLVAGVGTVALGGTAIAFGTQEAAAVTLDEIETSGGEFEAASVEPELQATVSYEYDVGSASTVTVWVAVDDDRVAETELYTSMASGSNEVELTAAVLDSDAFSASDFEVSLGEQTTVTVPMSVGVAVFDGESEQARAEESTSVDVTVTHPDDSDATASVGAVIDVTDAK